MQYFYIIFNNKIDNYVNCLHPALSCAAAAIFLQLYLKLAVPISFYRSLFQMFLIWSSYISVALRCPCPVVLVWQFILIIYLWQ